MIVFSHGEIVYTESEVLELLYQHPDLDLSLIKLEDHIRDNSDLNKFNRSAKEFHVPWKIGTKLTFSNVKEIKNFHKKNQTNWNMPEEYKQLDIAKWCLDQCKNDIELQRVGKELLMFQERNLFPLLQFLKYFIDTLRANKIVWGVGRGSSVSSYVLYLIGVHRINSIYYDLDIEEFLK